MFENLSCYFELKSFGLWNMGWLSRFIRPPNFSLDETWDRSLLTDSFSWLLFFLRLLLLLRPRPSYFRTSLSDITSN